MRPDRQLDDVAPPLAGFSVKSRPYSTPEHSVSPCFGCAGSTLDSRLPGTLWAREMRSCRQLDQNPLLRLFCFPGLCCLPSSVWFCPFYVSSRAGPGAPRPGPQHPVGILALALSPFFLCHLLLFPSQTLKAQNQCLTIADTAPEPKTVHDTGQTPPDVGPTDLPMVLNLVG